MALGGLVMDSPARWTAALRAARLGRLLGGRRRRISALPPPLSAWTGTRDVPYPTRPFRDWWSRREQARRNNSERPRGGAGPGAGGAGRRGRPPPLSRGYQDRRPAARPGRRGAAGTAGRAPGRLPGPGRRSGTAVAAAVVTALGERGAAGVVVPEGVSVGLDHLGAGIELVGDDPRDPEPSWTASTGSSPAARWPSRDRHDRARRRSRAGPAGPQPGPRLHLVVVTAAQVVAGVPGRGPPRPRPGRRPGSAGPARPATSSSTGSRASTAPGPSRSLCARSRHDLEQLHLLPWTSR